MQTEPNFKTTIIDNLNKAYAKKRFAIFLLLPQPAAVGEYSFAKFTGSDDEIQCYHDSGTLPRDLATIDQDTPFVLLRIFDARTTGGLLQELELDPVPEFQKFPALCIFDMGRSEMMNGDMKIALIPSACLDVVPTSAGQFQFILDKEGGMNEFATSGYQLAEALGTSSSVSLVMCRFA